MTSASRSFSVVIPTFNRPRPLAKCLAALSTQTHPRQQFEIIVVDDGGDADLAPVVDRVRNRLEIRLLRQANAGPAAARNTGAAAARNTYLAFTDDDCAPHPDWLEQLGAVLARAPHALVGGLCINALRRNAYASASQMILDVVHAHFNRDHEHATFFPSDNLAASRESFLEIGGFDRRFRWSEDRDLCDRWCARGWPMIVAPAR